jgi:hypothetical protein
MVQEQDEVNQAGDAGADVADQHVVVQRTIRDSPYLHHLIENYQVDFGLPLNGGHCEAVGEVKLSASQMEQYRQLTNILRNFEFITIYRFLLGKNKAHFLNMVKDTLTAKGHKVVDSPKPPLHIKWDQYFDMTQSLLAFDIIACYRYLECSKPGCKLKGKGPDGLATPDGVAQDVESTVKYFYANDIGIGCDGNVLDCDYLCAEGAKCVICGYDTPAAV